MLDSKLTGLTNKNNEILINVDGNTKKVGKLGSVIVSLLTQLFIF